MECGVEGNEDSDDCGCTQNCPHCRQLTHSQSLWTVWMIHRPEKEGQNERLCEKTWGFGLVLIKPSCAARDLKLSTKMYIET